MAPPTRSVGLADLPLRTPSSSGRLSPARPDTLRAAVDHRSVPSPVPSSVGKHRLDIAALRADGTRHITEMTVPALPLFESAFSAFAHGTLILTPRGEVGVEDLMPGEMVCTDSGQPAKLLWVGSGSFVPADAGYRASLVRVMADAFGMGRPDRFLTFGPQARILQTPAHLRAQVEPNSLLASVADFVDGVNVIEVTPPTPVTLYHLVLERHAVVRAGGLDCETFHPGGQATREVPYAMRDLFVSMFPHIAQVSDFGPLAHPRAPEPQRRERMS